MKLRSAKSAMAALFALGFVLVHPALAQSGGGMMDDKQGGTGPGMQQMSGMMRDMSGQMMGMSGNMSKGNMSSAQQKQMGERMREMAGMMDKMSGMMGRGMMMDTDTQMQMDQMRKRMDEMMKGAAGGK